MRRLQKSKRLTWAPDVNLCQVRLFLSEESPSQVGFGAQDHLQAKTSWLPHSTGVAPDDILPPGFEGGQPANVLQIKVSEVPVIKWRCPPRFVMNLTWQVVAGEESKEVEVQNQREMRVLEAVFPRPSAIPQNPTFNADIEVPQRDENHIPPIPIHPIEDEDASDAPSELVGPCNVTMNLQPQLLAPGVVPQCGIPSTSTVAVNERVAGGGLPAVEPDVMAAAFSSLNNTNEQGNLIDQELLIRILSNPTLVEKLVTDYGAASNAHNVSNPASSFVPLSDPSPPPVALSDPSFLHMNRAEPSVPPPVLATSSGSFYNQPNGVGPVSHPNAHVQPTGVPASSSAPPMGAPHVKDINYYKNLIHQHGGERLEGPQQYGSRYGHQMGTNQEIVNQKTRDSKAKIMKPCIYFNSSRGCRHGANCAYQHDSSSQQKGSSGMPDVQSAKRMKMDREISS